MDKLECSSCKKFRSARNIYKGVCRACRNRADKECFICGKQYYKTHKQYLLCKKHYNQLSWYPDPGQLSDIIKYLKR